MYATAVFHHSVVYKFCSRESKLIKHGCTILVAGGLCGDKGQGDEEPAKVRTAEQAQLVAGQEKMKDKVKQRENETPKPNKCWVSLLYRKDSVIVQV